MAESSGSGLTWRIAFSIISSMVWLIFVIAWLGFGLDTAEVGETIAVLCISSVIWMGANGLIWAIWPSQSKEKS
jgi:hypothetical protein